MSDHQSVLYESLTFIDKLYLGAYLRVYLSIDLQNIIEDNEQDLKVSPISNIDYDIREHLFLNNFLITDDLCEYIKMNIISSELSRSNIISELINPVVGVNNTGDEYLKLKKTIQTYEGFEYMKYVILNYNMKMPKFGVKFTTAIESILDTYTLPQLYYFIWSAVKDAAAYYQKEKCSSRALNTIPGRMLRRYEASKKNGWSITAFKRPINCIESEISLLLDIYEIN